MIMKKNYQRPVFLEIKLKTHLLQTISGEQDKTGTPSGEGAGDLSRQARFSGWED